MIEEVAKGIYRILVPLPGNDLRDVNAYLVRGERDLLIDTGFDMDECEKALDDAFEALGVSKERLDVCVTHLHPDHSGLVGRLAACGARVHRFVGKDFIPIKQEYEEWLNLMCPYLARDGEGERAKSLVLALSGSKPEMFVSGEDLPGLVDLKEGYAFEVGEYRLRCIETVGHHHSHVCLYDEGKKILFSGDHVLMGISPSVSTFVIDRNPLGDYLSSLRKIRDLDVELTLPGHRAPFASPHERIDELVAHHEARLDEIRRLLEQGIDDVLDLARNMVWNRGRRTWESMPIQMKDLALGETIAHLTYLESRKELVLEQDADGIISIRKA